MKKLYCLNAILALVLCFLSFGYAGYLAGKGFFANHVALDDVLLILYNLAVLVMALLVLHQMPGSTKAIVFAAVFSSAGIAFVWIFGFLSWLTDANRGAFMLSTDPVSAGVLVAVTVLSLLLSAIYSVAAIKNHKEDARLAKKFENG